MADLWDLGKKLLDAVPLDSVIDYSKGLFSSDDAEDSVKEIRDLVKNKDLRSDLEELGVDVKGAGRRVSEAEAIERMGPLAEKLLDGGKLDDKILDNDEKFEASVAAIKGAMDDKGVAAFDKLPEEQQEALIVLLATPDEERIQAIKDVAEASRAAKPQASIGETDESFAATTDGQAVAQNSEQSGDIDVNWDDGANQLTTGFQGKTGVEFVETVEHTPDVEADISFKV
ncbi:MAG: hypothetical protein COA45_09840 [Zetaproteobacteria bacterium]|nr:MAG: hypothetical protein COA45_09840 [Zetaproteobacteria bacterium]